jgi:hypothetical protein
VLCRCSADVLHARYSYYFKLEPVVAKALVVIVEFYFPQIILWISFQNSYSWVSKFYNFLLYSMIVCRIPPIVEAIVIISPDND